MLQGEGGNILKLEGREVESKDKKDHESILIKTNSRSRRQFYLGVGTSVATMQAAGDVGRKDLAL